MNPRSIRRIPFTLLFTITIIAVAFWNGSAQGNLSDELKRAWGFGPLYFWREHWHTLVTGAFFVRNTIMLLAMVLFVRESADEVETVLCAAAGECDVAHLSVHLVGAD